MFIEDNMEIYVHVPEWWDDEGVTRSYIDCPHCNQRVSLEVDPGDTITVNGSTLLRMVDGMETTSDGHHQLTQAQCPHCETWFIVPENDDKTSESDDEPLSRP